MESINDLKITNHPEFDRIKKISVAINERVRLMIQETYDFSDINFDNIEQVYNYNITGIKSFAETKEHLISRGMSVTLAEKLLNNYLKKIEISC